jgi:hypothetical protein
MGNLVQGQLKAIAAELADSVKIQVDLSELSNMLASITIEAVLGVEME